MLTVSKLLKAIGDIARTTKADETLFDATVCFDLDGFKIPLEDIEFDIEKRCLVLHENQIL